jgi:protein TonB
MYNLEAPSMVSGRRGVALLAAVLLHVLLAVAMVKAFSRIDTQRFETPLIVTIVAKPKVEVPPPPPPTPQMQTLLPLVPPPLVVTVRMPVETITATAVPSSAPPAPPAPHAVARTAVAVDPRHPLRIGEEYYPEQAKRLGEEGVCYVQVRVGVNGRVTGAVLKRSAGSVNLDEACLKGVRDQRMLPATEDGKPVESVTVIPIRWSLHAGR